MPGFAEAYYGRAIAWLIKGERQKARQDLAEVLRLKSGTVVAAQALEILAFINRTPEFSPIAGFQIDAGKCSSGE